VIIPDIRLAANESERWRRQSAGPTSTGPGVIEPMQVTTFIDDEIHEARIEVIDSENRSVVTVIEILSPSNKVPGSRGQESYQGKRREIMLSSSHLVEIDLLRAGTRIFIREHLPPHEYLVHVSRATATKRRRGTVWPIPITKPLPLIPLPLRGEDPDAQIDLQQMLATAYDRGAYDLDIDYIADPISLLTSDQADWARKIVSSRKPA
jgi:hypothetical protein